MDKTCIDCDHGPCHMNCGPSIKPSSDIILIKALEQIRDHFGNPQMIAEKALAKYKTRDK